MLLDFNWRKTIYNASPIRVLIVDDSKPWMNFVHSMLDKESDVRIVGTAFDGYEAVAQAQILQPSLVLMDISLPKLSGIEAARRITSLVPGTKIIFVSQHRESGVVQAAMGAGGQGYVVKMDVVRELVQAMNSVVLGYRYFSTGLLGLDLPDTTEM